MKRGFTIIETLVALTLVTLGLLFMARIMICSLESTRNSSSRFNCLQEYVSFQNKLFSAAFDSPELSPGVHRLQEGGTCFCWDVVGISEGLKKISLRVSRKVQIKSNFFYRSNAIKEVNYHD